MGKAGRGEKAFERIQSRMLSFGITLSGGDGTALTLTSRAYGEGVTTIALGLANELSLEGKTLLIDASSEGIRVAEALDVSTVPLKVEDMGKLEFEKSRHITHLKDPKLDILTLAIPRRGGSDPIDFSVPFMKDIRSYYNSIIVDTGSLQKPSAQIWHQWTDHTLLVIDTTTTTQEILERFRSDLNRIDIKLSGFIMNKRSFHIPGFLWSKIG